MQTTIRVRPQSARLYKNPKWEYFVFKGEEVPRNIIARGTSQTEKSARKKAEADARGYATPSRDPKWRRQAKKRVKRSHHEERKRVRRTDETYNRWYNTNNARPRKSRKGDTRSGPRPLGRDARKSSVYEKGAEDLRKGYSVSWRPKGAGVAWYLRSPSKKVVAFGNARTGDDAIQSAKSALAGELYGSHGSSMSRGHAYKTSAEHRAHHGKSRSSRDVSRSGDSAVFYSGDLTIRLRYVEPEQYRTQIEKGGRKVWSGTIRAPRGGYDPRAGYGGHSYDSRHAYMRSAKAALSFAENDKPGLSDSASWGEAGPILRTYTASHRGGRGHR